MYYLILQNILMCTQGIQHSIFHYDVIVRFLVYALMCTYLEIFSYVNNNLTRLIFIIIFDKIMLWLKNSGVTPKHTNLNFDKTWHSSVCE